MIRLAFVLLGMTACVAAQTTGSRAAPEYSEDTVFNAASFEAKFASGALVGISGKNLAWAERWRADRDVQAGTLPTTLPDTWVTVSVAGLPAAIEYASPEQVLFLIPPGLKPGQVALRLTVAGLAGPKITLFLQGSAPALYRLRKDMALARHRESMEFVSPENPARPGEELILYANGLGATVPAQKLLAMPRAEAELKQRQDLSILLEGEEVAKDLVGYAGIMPGYPGFYEIRVRLPEVLPDNPQIRVCLAGECSPEGIVLRTTGPEAEPAPVQPEEQPARSDN